MWSDILVVAPYNAEIRMVSGLRSEAFVSVP